MNQVMLHVCAALAAPSPMHISNRLIEAARIVISGPEVIIAAVMRHSHFGYMYLGGVGEGVPGNFVTNHVRPVKHVGNATS